VLLENQKLSIYLGDRTAKAFDKYLGIQTISELLEHFPRRYSKRGELTPLDQLPIGETVTVVGEVYSTSSRRTKGKAGNLLEVVISDGKNQVSLTFFNQAWRQKELVKGVRGFFSGKIASYAGKFQLSHPDYELFPEVDAESAANWAEKPIPIYPSAGTLKSWKIQQSIEIVLENFGSVRELLPFELLEKNSLVNLSTAIRLIHNPTKDEDWKSARESIRFHEAVLLQLGLANSRALREKQKSSVRMPGVMLETFDKMLPFELTNGQQEVSKAIEGDLASGRPMHRLLQGEVGSGKTLVALRAILTVAESGGQSALLAPTEVLAVQHYESIRATLGPELAERLGLRLLTGQLSTAEKKRTLLDMASGKALLVVGTHALISEKALFFDLSLVVIDEQHRFGVGQRETLRAKGNTSPHVLTMTATPIPRTVAISVFGDLEVSTLSELPAGRQEISTFVVEVSNSALVSRMWQRVSEELASGRQAFVVCPRIDGKDSEESSNLEESDEEIVPASAVEIFESLKRNASLAGFSIGLMHGKLSSEEKAEVMTAFSANEIQVLVSTTVIEVGVNVPNASAMVILDAEHFGISQLHQLRGRVGRGAHSGICFLTTAASQGSVSLERLRAVAGTTDGFKLSELDLEIRGEGDVLGNVQSGGRSQLKLLRVIRDADLIAKAREISLELLQAGLSTELSQAISGDASALEQS